MYQTTNMNLAMFKQICRKETSSCQSDGYMYKHRLAIIKSLMMKLQKSKGVSVISNDIISVIELYLSEAHERRNYITSLYCHIIGLKASVNVEDVKEAFDLPELDDELVTYLKLCEEYLIKAGKLISEFIPLASEFLTKVNRPVIVEGCTFK